MFGGIEAGGTKFVCGAGTGPEDLETSSFATTTPKETVALAVEFFRQRRERVRAIGIGSFGPVDLNCESPTYGFITSTPKAGWANCDLLGVIRRELKVPVAFDTDVNTALIGEARWGAARGLSDAVYLTIGTGVGGGAMVQGRVVHGLVHPEIGHLRIPHDLIRDPFPGSCPYHGDCLEGLASGPALQARWGVPGNTLPESHEAWSLEAHYIALGVANLMLTLSTQRFLLGGGVMQNPHLFPIVRREFGRILNGYVRHESILENLDRFIVPPQLQNRAGVLGALALGEAAFA